MDLSTTTDSFAEADAKFETQFATTFHADASWSDSMKATAKYALGNMLGSIAYMYGDRLIFDNNKVIIEPPTSLFTGIPDRPDHGRGFMWDEGFHNHLISVWNMDLTQQIIASWFATTNSTTGWICRE